MKHSPGKLDFFDAIPFFLLFLIAFLPLIVFFVSAFQELGNPVLNANAGSILEKVRLILSSLIISFIASLLSLIIGATLAFLIARTNLFYRRVLKFILFIPFFIPPYIQAYAWTLLLGKRGILNVAAMKLFALSKPLFTIYGVKGVIFILALSYFPVVFLLTLAGLESWDPSLEESCSLYCSRKNVARYISFPLISPYLISGFILSFIFSLSQFSVPALLEVKTYSVDLFAQISSFFNESRVALNSMPLFAITVLLIYLLSKMLQKGYYFVTPAKTDERKIDLKKTGQFFGLSFSLIIVLLSIVFPLGELIFQTKSVDILFKAIASSKDAIIFSVLIAFIAATMAAALSFFLASKSADTRMEFPLKVASAFLLMIPASIMAIGMIKLWNHKLSEFIYSSPVMIIFVFVALFIPYGIFVLLSNFKQVDRSLEEAASLCGAGRPMVIKKVLYPLLKPGLWFSWIVAFTLCLGELTATILVIPPGRETISLRTFSLMHYGESSFIAATALIPIMIFALALAAFGLVRITGKAWK
jgi:iron(III) transport system permease protein